jgi:hypothetical protein
VQKDEVQGKAICMSGPGQNDPIGAAIELHLQIAGELMAARQAAAFMPALSNADVIARLDLILAKLNMPAVPPSEQLWTLAEIAEYFHRHVETVRESMACLPGFPLAINLPGRGAGRGKPLYRAAEVIQWAVSYQEQRHR